MEFTVSLNMVEDVKEFVRLAELYDTDIIVSNQEKRLSVDASSIMGVFSLDLSKPVIVNVKDQEAGKMFKEDVKKFVL